jgi:hypothetical protein
VCHKVCRAFGGASRIRLIDGEAVVVWRQSGFRLLDRKRQGPLPLLQELNGIQSRDSEVFLLAATGPVEGFVLDLTRVWRGFRV